ncbi:MAG: LptF/LptG family permease [Heliobacteriaceae bacterium]|jgi:lipopolysaccharide export system permease protein|nr:LptF/LptG family permease [Heliobacteriaceae bacterium]
MDTAVKDFLKQAQSNVKELLKKMTILDKYILRQIIEMFIMGVCVFTSIIFASDTFITLIKQISLFGIPFKVAVMMIILNLPSVVVMTIPMGVLLATVMTLNRLSLASEITVMRACGVGLNRIAKPIFIFAILMSFCGFFINESIVPVMTKQSKDLALWALGQKNIPEGKENFVFKELSEDGSLKRLFYVGLCKNRILHNITVLDNSKNGSIQVLQANEGKTSPEGWKFQKGAIYTIGSEGKILNTTLFDDSNVKFGVDLSKELDKNIAKEMNFTNLIKYIKNNPIDKQKRKVIRIELYDKLALPLTTIAFVLIGVPLAITPPRVRYNRGFLFSIAIIFAYYLIRALSVSFGETGALAPFLAAWMPNIVLTILGVILYYKKVFTIN